MLYYFISHALAHANQLSLSRL